MLWLTAAGEAEAAEESPSITCLVASCWQVGCIFAALVADGVWMVLPWLVFHSQNMDLLRQYMLKPGKLSAVVLSVLALLACAAANSVVACFEPRVLGTLYLLVWTTAECARVAWEVAGLQDQSRPLDIGMQCLPCATNLLC